MAKCHQPLGGHGAGKRDAYVPLANRETFSDEENAGGHHHHLCGYLHRPVSSVATHGASPLKCSWHAIVRRLDLKVSPTFILNLELSLRGTLVMILLVRPFILDGQSFGFLSPLRDRGLITSFVVVYAIYNMAPTLGEVIQGTISSLRGVAVVILNVWLLELLFGPGVTSTSPSYIFWLGLANGAIFVFLMLLLKCDMSFKTFGINMFAGYLMDFLNPSSQHRIRLPWQKGFPLEDDGMKLWLQYLVGSGMIILALLLPYPMLARHKAYEKAERLATEMPFLLKSFLKFYVEQDPEDQEAKHRALEQLDELRTQHQGYLAQAYWECFGLGSYERSRCAMQELGKTVGKCIDHIYSMWGAAIRESRGTAPSQLSAALMERLRLPLEHCCDQIESVMTRCLRASADGHISDHEAAQLVQAIQEVDAAKHAVAQELYRALDDLVFFGHDTAAKTKLCLEELNTPLALCHSVAGICALAAKFAQTIVDVRDAKKAFPEVVEPSALSIFEGIFKAENLGFTFRSCLSIFLAFFVGLVGYGNMVPKYNADIAGTAAVLLVTHTGSALAKSTNRAQGVTLGLVFGLLLKQMFNGCAWYEQLCLLLSFAIWSAMSIFGRFHFASASDVTKFMGAFGDQQMIKTGSNDPTLRICERGPPTQAESFLKIETTVLAIGILFLVDFLFAHERASTGAYHKFQDALRKLKEAATYICDAQPGDISAGHYTERVLASITGAAAMGKEAAQEPRWWRIPWQGAVWDVSIRRLGQLRYAIASLEHNLPGDEEVHKEVRKLVTSTRLSSTFQANLDALMEDAKFFAHETTDRFVAQDPKSFAESRQEEKKALEQFVLEVSAASFMSHRSMTLEDDPLCIVSSVINAFHNAFFSMGKLQHSIVFY